MRIVYLNSDSPYIIGKQGETNSVTLRVDVTEWASAFPDGTGVILFTRPNKVVYPLETNTIELDGKTYLQTIITAKENNMPGWVVLQAQWYNGDTLVKSMLFSGKVLVSGDGSSADPTETVPNWVTEWMETLRTTFEDANQIFEALENIDDDLEASRQAVNDSEAWARGTRSGEAVDPTDETYHNNSKYYSEQIEATAEDVEAWANGTRGGVNIDSSDPAYQKNGKYYNTQAAASASAAAESASQAMSGTPEGYAALVTSVTDLKTAFDDSVGGITEIKKYYSFDPANNNKYIKTNFNIGEAVNLTPTTTSGATDYHYMIVECSEGDVFDIDVTIAAANPRAWVFTDASNVVLHRCSNASRPFNGRVVAPEGAAKLIINDKYTVKSGTVCKVTGHGAVENLSNKLNALENSVGSGVCLISDSYWEPGIFVPGTGEAPNSSCCRTDGRIMPIPGTYTVVPKEGYEVRVSYYNQYVADFTPKPVTFNTDGTNNVRIVVRRIDYADILPHGTADIPDDVYEMDADAVTYIYFATDTTLTLPGKWADAKATGDRLTPVEARVYNRLPPEPPSYYIDHLDSKIATIKEKMQAAGQNSFTFAFITDIHWENNEQHSPSLMRYIMDRVHVNDVICGGDMITQGEKATMLNDAYDCINAFKSYGITFPVVIGNHDHNWNIAGGQRSIEPCRRFTDGEVWASMEAQYDKHQRVFWDGEFNYYIDYPESNTRVIVINTGDTDVNNVLQWDNYKNFCDTLAASADKHIIVFSHGLNESHIGGKLSKLCFLFNNREKYTGNYTHIPSFTYDFSKISETKTGNVYAIIGGHNHTDGVYTIDGCRGPEENEPYFPNITRTTDSKYVSQSAPVQPVPGTITEQAFDIVTISYDASTPKVSFVRIGRGDDLEYSPTIPIHTVPDNS